MTNMHGIGTDSGHEYNQQNYKHSRKYGSQDTFKVFEEFDAKMVNANENSFDY